MEVAKFLELSEAVPFRPLQFFLSDGRNFVVNHPDYLAFEAGAGTMTIYDEQSNFAEVIDIFAVVSIRHEIAR
jgi:hypothetical protein